LESYGTAVLKDGAGILAYGDTVTNGNDRVLDARHKADVSTIFVKNLSGDFVRVATSVPDGVEGSHQTAVGTTLTRNGAAWNALTGINGAAPAEYCGAVKLFGTMFDSVYRPIKDGGGIVVGALFIGDEAP
jgi:methyl-accepting chemotaxis protein-2 (aspartate sensor receptor)